MDVDTDMDMDTDMDIDMDMDTDTDTDADTDADPDMDMDIKRFRCRISDIGKMLHPVYDIMSDSATFSYLRVSDIKLCRISFIADIGLNAPGAYGPFWVKT
jgi:hypothetical protein